MACLKAFDPVLVVNWVAVKVIQKPYYVLYIHIMVT